MSPKREPPTTPKRFQQRISMQADAERKPTDSIDPPRPKAVNVMEFEKRYIGMSLDEVISIDGPIQRVKNAFLTLVNLDGDIVDETERLRLASRRTEGAKRDYQYFQRWSQRMQDDLLDIEIALRSAIVQRRVVLQLIVAGLIDPREMNLTATPAPQAPADSRS
jgi:hypothetical protein